MAKYLVVTLEPGPSPLRRLLGSTLLPHILLEKLQKEDSAGHWGAPDFDMICGHNSVKRVTRRGVLNLYRCGDGHFFIFDTEKEAQEKPQ
jgi:hypothetical protein